MRERQEGWYWVKLKHSEWVPCEWIPDENYPEDKECWVGAPLSPIGYADDLAFEEIGPRIPTPDEPWQTVPIDPESNMSAFGGSAVRADTTTVNKLWIAGKVWRAMLAAAPDP